ncbi:VWA domain-containing protein [Actinopolymorpha sp. B17G11]|uniref:VWA domain-containing protein n=1 Tax=Actinopolymorpha sp. B17G11 TaxID=3160861 RepID=UPI0032E3F1B3
MLGRAAYRHLLQVATALAAASLAAGPLVAPALATPPTTLPTLAAPPSALDKLDKGEASEGSLLLVLDSSGSMKEADQSGTSKISAAKQALNTVVDKLPGDAVVGLRVYGATVFEKSDPGACTDSQLVVPIRPADKPALKTAIAKYKPYGETPIAHSLKQAAKDLGTEGKRTILLVSDGEETCTPDPCLVARDIHAKGIDLKIDVVGLHVGAAAKRQLSCIADAGGGTYYDADDAGDLAASLDQSALRAFTDFAVSGTPVKGGLQPGEAPEIGAGQYTDTLASPTQQDGRVKYYMLTRTPGSTLHAAATSRPEKRSGSAASSDELKLELLTPAGDEECTWGNGAAFEWSSTRDFLNASVFQGPNGNSSASTYVPDECKTSDRLLLKVERSEEDGAASGPEDPMELVVIEEPPLDGGVEQLPEQVEEADIDFGALPAGQSQGKADGGGGFADATTLTPGHWTGTLQPGEQLFYRVRADWGQSVAVTFRLPANPALDSQLGQLGEKVEIRAYGPDRAEFFLPGGTEKNFTGTTRTYSRNQVFHATLPEVRYRNREDGGGDTIQAASLAGHYYVAIQQNADDEGRKYQEPIDIAVAVKGEVSGEPTYLEPDPEPEPAKTEEKHGEAPAGSSGASGSSGSSGEGDASEPSAADGSGSLMPVAVAGGSGAVVLLGVILAVFLLRRPRSTPAGAPGQNLPWPPPQPPRQPPQQPNQGPPQNPPPAPPR